MSYSLAGAVNAEAVPMLLKRNIGGSYDANGEFVPADGAQIEIRATIQPASGRVLRDLDEGVRKTADFVLWSTATIAVDDQIVYGGANYRVLVAKHRPEGGFTRAIIGKLRV